MTKHEEESIIFTELLNYLGYGKQMISFRRNVNQCLVTILNDKMQFEHSEKCVLAGSKAEGLTAPHESDIDLMIIPTDICCREHFNQVAHEEGEQVNEFYLDTSFSSPGYTLLRNTRFCRSLPSAALLHESMVEDSSCNLYISSDFLRNHLKKLERINCQLPGNQGILKMDDENHGPSITIKITTIKTDKVIALKCECPSYQNNWIHRRRFHQWPPVEVIRDVCSLPSHVVPVGNSARIEFRFLEWRICFTEGETRLVKSLNDCLTHVYILLKQIAKITLKPLSRDMSSYVMKNVVFWLAERNDFECFQQQTLIPALKMALTYLKHFVVENNLPCYMISQRNLLEGKLSREQRNKICMRIDFLLKEGPYMVLNIRKIRDSLSMFYLFPRDLRFFSIRLHQAQITLLLANCFLHLNSGIPGTVEDVVGGNNFRILRNLVIRLHLICLSERDDIVISYEDIEEMYNSCNHPEELLCSLRECSNQSIWHPLQS